MRKVLFATLLGLLLAAPAAGAAPPAPPPDAAAPVVGPVQLDTPQPISILELPDVRRTGGIETGTRPGTTKGHDGDGASALDCGACLVSCWGVTARNGPSDWSGHAYIYNHLDWCGNGAHVTYATSWQSYDQSGWFRIGNTYGPWWSGGGAGYSYVSASGYMLWTESIPIIGVDHNGTTWLTVTGYAWGGSAAS